jgi:hypothetical protein
MTAPQSSAFVAFGSSAARDPEGGPPAGGFASPSFDGFAFVVRFTC